MKIKIFIHIILFFTAFNNIFITNHKLYANETERKIPKFVYRSSPSKPEDKFKNGFVRDRSLSTDLGSHISGDSGDTTAFISTTSNQDYARQVATSYAMGWWYVREFFVYEIIPQSNFVDLAETYSRTLTNSTTSTELRTALENSHDTFTRESEYSALYEIRPETIISATRFEFDSVSRQFLQRETIENNVTRIDRNNPQIEPSLHENNFPLGTFRSMQIQFDHVSSGFACYVAPSSSSMRKKRNTGNSNYICPISGKNVFEEVESPDNILSDNKFKLQIKVFNDKLYCLTPKNGDYIYIDYCENSSQWNYTDFGQIITLINDGKNDQYYCLTAPINDNNYNYIKIKICDLNLKEQKWNLIPHDNSNYLITSFDNKYLNSYNNYYLYLDNNFDSSKTIQVLNYNEIKKPRPMIQFSLDTSVNGKYSIYLSSGKSMYIGSPSKILNYYNAHNNILFSNYGYDNIESQVCYYSSLIKKGGSSSDWVNAEYCSSNKFQNKEFVWILNKNSFFNYFITDIGENALRFDNIILSSNRYYAYTAYTYWHDNSSFLNKFKFSLPEKTYANYYSKGKNLSQKERLKNAYNGIKKYYYKYHFE